VGVYDVVEHGGAAFLAMELVEGISLQRLLRLRKTLEPGEAAHVGLGVARALAAAHEAGLVHHDVKPGNILLGFNGDIKVTDFGIARFISEVSEDPDVVYGTPGYLPPETLRGEGYDELGDVFALGVVMFQAMAGLLPRLTRSLRNTMVVEPEGEPEAVAEYNPLVPTDLDRLVQWLLAPQRSERLPSAVVAARRLERLIAEHGWKWSPPLRGEASGEMDHVEDVEHSRFVRTRVLGRSGGPGRGPGGRPPDRGAG
jgi:serine/threonine-protein kinase